MIWIFTEGEGPLPSLKVIQAIFLIFFYFIKFFFFDFLNFLPSFYVAVSEPFVVPSSCRNRTFQEHFDQNQNDQPHRQCLHQSQNHQEVLLQVELQLIKKKRMKIIFKEVMVGMKFYRAIRKKSSVLLKLLRVYLFYIFMGKQINCKGFCKL